MKQTPASRKVNEQARELIASILLTEVNDPRLFMVTVTDVEVSIDRSVMNVYVVTDPGRYDDVLEGLESAKGKIRTELGKQITWRVTPQLRFFIDGSIDEAARIQEALKEVPSTLKGDSNDGDKKDTQAGEEGLSDA